MNKFYQSIFAVFICSIALSNNSLDAQELYASQPQDEKVCTVETFAAVNVTDKMEVTLKEGRCAVVINGDEALLPYVQVSVKDSTLYIDYDEKAVPSEIKKLYRGRNAPVPILRASVSAPAFSGITASRESSIRGNGTVFADNIEINLYDSADIQDLKLEAAYAKLRMSKNSYADVQLDSDSQLELSLEGNSKLKLGYKAHNLLLYQTGNSSSILSGESTTASCDILGSSKSHLDLKGKVLVLYAGGSADVSLAGEMGDFTLTAERAAKVESLEMKTMRVKAGLTGWTRAIVNAEELLSVNLGGGSSLYYTGGPAIQVGKIVKSTLAPYETEEKP